MFPHLCSVDRHVFVDLEAQPDLPASDLEHRDSEQVLEAVRAPDDHGFQAPP
jgi:hypothetical protein